MEQNKIPTAKELFEIAKQVGYDSFGFCVDLELCEVAERLLEQQKLKQRTISEKN